MKPQDLREMIGKMTPAPWSRCGSGVTDFDRLWPGSLTMELLPNGRYDCDVDGNDLPEGVGDTAREEADAYGIATLRNLAPALVELWEAVETYRKSRYSSVSLVTEAAHDALLAAAERVGG